MEDVASAGANARTADQWNAYKGMKGDNLPEVPPDGERAARWRSSLAQHAAADHSAAHVLVAHNAACSQR